MKRPVIFLLTFVALWALWFFGFPYTLIYREGLNFFCTLPDYIGLNLDMPGAPLQYIASFLLQFYKWPAVGAAIHSLLAVLAVFLLWCVVRRLFREPEGLLWVAYLPLPFIVYEQMSDLTLYVSIIILAVSAATALAALLLNAFWKYRLPLPEFMRNRWVGIALTAVALSLSFIIALSSPVSRRYEEITHLQVLAAEGDWEGILKEVSRDEAVEDSEKRRYALLALTHTGRLADDAFRYGLSGSQDFIYDGRGVMQTGFNMIFCSSVGLVNQAILYAYEYSALTKSGVSFSALRTLADCYISLKDYTLAKKYIDILSHSTCNRKWVKERLAALETIRNGGPDYTVPEIKRPWGIFLTDMVYMSDLHPENVVYLDFVLCGMLADRNGFGFYDVFNDSAGERVKSSGRIPRIYQEALLMFIGHRPEELAGSGIDGPVLDDYRDFTDLVRQGKGTYARRRYSGTYWAYLYR